MMEDVSETPPIAQQGLRGHRWGGLLVALVLILIGLISSQSSPPPLHSLQLGSDMSYRPPEGTVLNPDPSLPLFMLHLWRKRKQRIAGAA